MAEEIVFYTNPRSRGAIARWMLEEVGVPYRAEVLGFGPPMKGGDYRALNPMGKVPTIVHRGNVVTECAAICAYLADAFPEAGLAPAPGKRAAYYRWMFFAAGPLEAAVTNRALGVEVPPDKRGFVGYGSFDAVMDALETAVAGPFRRRRRASRRRTSMSARRSAGGCSSARSRRARPSRPTGTASRTAPPAPAPPRSTPPPSPRRAERPWCSWRPGGAPRGLPRRAQARLVAGQRARRGGRARRSSWPSPPTRRPSSPASMTARPPGRRSPCPTARAWRGCRAFAAGFWDAGFAGSVGLRWQPGSSALPPHVLGHIGYAVVPWHRRRGLATRALAALLPLRARRGP